MYIYLRHLLRVIFGTLGLGLVKRKDLDDLRAAGSKQHLFSNKIDFYERFLANRVNPPHLMEVFLDSKSENGQDLFALRANGFKENLTFLEVGALDGIEFSNTFLLEKNFGWKGLLVECNPRNYQKIKDFRSCKALQVAAVDYDSDLVSVYEPPASNLSHLASPNLKSRLSGRVHRVKGQSLNTIIEEHLAINQIDFFSIDIEGEELRVLSTLDFSRFKFNAIVVEHNFRSDKDSILKLFKLHGYEAVCKDISKNDFWFVPKESSVMWN